MKILLIAYDNDSHLPFFPINLFYLLGHLVGKNHQVGLWHQDLHHGRDASLRSIVEDSRWDVVGIGACAGYYQHRKLKALSEQIAKAKNRRTFQYVLGGHGPAGAPEYFLEAMGADSVVIGDGEDGFDQIMAGARGIIQAAPCNDERAPLDAYRYFPLDLYRLVRWPTSTRPDFCFPILTSRGCKWHCSFCYRMREGYHMRSPKAIIEEIKHLQSHAGITHFQFADELLMASEARTAEVCDAILSAGLGIKWDCNGRLNYAKPKLLEMMKRAGCEYVNYGIESLNQDRLNAMGKGLTVDRIHDGVEDTLASGLSPGLNLLWGFPGDTQAELDAAVGFLIQYDPCDELRTIRPVTPYPGCALYHQAMADGLLTGPADFYAKHVNSDALTVNFTDIPDGRFNRMLGMANMKLYDNYCRKKRTAMERDAMGFYGKPHGGFRGWRAV